MNVARVLTFKAILNCFFIFKTPINSLNVYASISVVAYPILQMCFHTCQIYAALYICAFSILCSLFLSLLSYNHIKVCFTFPNLLLLSFLIFLRDPTSVFFVRKHSVEANTCWKRPRSNSASD